MKRSAPAPAVALACARLLAASVDELTCLSLAPRSAVYRARLADKRTVIVKLYEGSAGWKAIKEQQAIDLVAAHTTLSAPRVLACGPLAGHDAMALIITDLGAFSLGRAVAAGEHTRYQSLNLLGQVLARFHRLPQWHGPRSKRGPSTWQAAFTDQVATLHGRCPDEVLATAQPALQRAQELTCAADREVWCHGDLHPHNVFLHEHGTGGKVPYVIDFEQMVRAVPEYDIAQTLVTSDALTGSEVAQVVAGYGPGPADELLNALIVFHVLRGWVYAAVLERRDRRLWATRTLTVLDRYAGLF